MRPEASASPQKRPGDFDLAPITKSVSKPNRLILHACEGWGKTSFAAQAPAPVFLMTKGEDGLLKLKERGLVDVNTAHFPECAEKWVHVLKAVDWLARNEHPFKTFCMDAINGAERLCHEHVCATKYEGDWSEKGFLSYQKGYEVSIPEWLRLLSALDALREKGVSILLLCHTKVSAFRNPEGADFDRYQPDLQKQTWSVTHKWADLVLFGHFETNVALKQQRDTKGKGQGGTERVLKCVRTAAWDAKNRHGLPDEIECGDSAESAWKSFLAALKK